ncbi:MAG: hypothetical protein Q9179_001154 [Wetmoreana sp. 5 TL-2023]
MSPSTIRAVRHIQKMASKPGDGIGPEVIRAGIQVLHKLASVSVTSESISNNSTGEVTCICQPLQQFANLRPTRVLRGTTSPLRNCPPANLDWLIIRENTKGEHAGQEGRTHIGTPWEVATEVAIFSRRGVERLMRFAFECAQKRPKKKITVVTKSSAQGNGLVLWDEVEAAVAKDFSDVEMDMMFVDAMTVRMTLESETLDTIVA